MLLKLRNIFEIAAEFIRYSLVGIVLNGSGYVAFLFLVYGLEISQFTSITLIFPSFTLIGLILQSRFVFKKSKTNLANLFPLSLLYITNYSFNIAGMWLLSVRFNIEPAIAQILLVTFMVAYTFKFTKHIINRKGRNTGVNNDSV